MSVEVLQKKFEDELESFKKAQKDMSKTTSMRSQLDAQLNENSTVQEELSLLDDDSQVFKLIGPALVRQDLQDAKQNVDKRINYITEELKRHDTTLESLEKLQSTKKESLGKLQTQVQQAMAKAAAQAQ